VKGKTGDIIMKYIGPLLLQVVLIALNAIFASAEAAFLSINSARIEKIIEEGDKKTRKKAKRLQKLTKWTDIESNKFLADIFSCIFRLVGICHRGRYNLLKLTLRKLQNICAKRVGSNNVCARIVVCAVNALNNLGV
jgi:hypothetical protein